MGAPTILVLAPMPAFPTSAGNRRRLVTTCESLQRGGFAVDLAYFAHEDQIYRRFGQTPPTDAQAMADAFQRTFRIEPRAAIPLKTRARCFGIDDWCPDEVGAFVAWYFSAFPQTCAIVVNYVFLSRCLAQVPPGVPTLIDTHDRFADRQLQYRPFRAEPNFFYTDRAGEAAGLGRADVALAIQSEEAAHFQSLTDRPVHLLPPRFLPRRPFAAPDTLARIGFIGHGNDPNLFSIGKFAHAWAAGWHPGRPELVIAGEICNSLGGLALPGVRLAGYVDRLEDFYDEVDLVVAPMLMGSGLKMKVAEALSFGLPVVGTTIGFEGFAPVIPAHRADGIAQVKEAVLALADDPAGLAALTQACADLFTRYNALSQQAEDGLVEVIRRAIAPAPSAAPEPIGPAVRAQPPRSLALGSVRLTCEHSLRTLPTAGGGILVATERGPVEGGDPYTPLRRRWFADPAPDAAPAAPPPDALGLAGAVVSLSPEWVRDRRLPPQARADLAILVAQAVPDWQARARVVGLAEGGLVLTLLMPSVLVSGVPHGAVFRIEAGRARELTLERVRPTLADPGLPFAGVTRDDLTPVSAVLTLRDDAPVPDRLLFLTDDLIGSILLDRTGVSR